MQPLLVGEPTQQLYAVYHPALANKKNGHGVVMCYPLGHEYMRIHAIFKQMAIRLASEGFEVIRFDYRSTGDSNGDDQRFSMAAAIDDTQAMMRELQAMTQVSKCHLVGLRLGATIALAATIKQRQDTNALAIASVVLWDLIDDTAAFVDELTAQVEQGDSAMNSVEPDAWHLLGFSWSRRLIDELRGWRFDALDGLSSVPLLSLQTGAIQHHGELHQALAASTAVTAEHLHWPMRWLEFDPDGAAFLPQPVVTKIVEWVAAHGE